MGAFKTLAGKLFAYNDGAFDRASMGNLDPYTGPNGVTSPAQAGFRALDGNGNAIFDSMGLIAVMNLLADQATGSINQPFSGIGSANAVDITGSSAFFSVDQQARLLVLCQVAFSINTGSGDYAYVYLELDGAQVGRRAIQGTSFAAYTATIIIAPLVAVGNHVLKLKAYVGSGVVTGIVYEAEIFTFKAGRA